MYCVKKMTEDLYWVGASERRLNLFENAYPLTNGVSYNSYLLLDEKTVLIDTVDKSVSGLYFENVEHVLSGRKLDYLIVQHMEPDHAATIGELVLRHPEVTVVCNAKTRTMMQNFFTFDIDSRVQLVKEMDTLTTGRHTFAFVMAPMVHWPEVMVSYDTTTKTLYSADAFGTFGALNGNLYADEVNFRTEWLADARRYYTNIVGKYGTQVQALLKKAAGLEIEMICPLHGPVWRKDIAWFLDKYIHWATYTPEDDAVVIAYASVYGGTENAANVLAAKLSDLGVRNVQMYDVSVTHPSYILSECFRASHLVFISTTYNAGMFVTTGFIPLSGNVTKHIYRIGGDGIIFSKTEEHSRVGWYDSTFQLLGNVMPAKKIDASVYYPSSIPESTTAMTFQVTETASNVPASAAYFRVSAKGKGANLIITIDEPIE